MEDDAQRYHCSYCGCDITLRLKCNICTDFDLCLHCFSAGAALGSHKPDHPYQLIDEGSFPLLTDDWGAIDEVLLLDAVEQDGFGNWEDIAAHVVTKTARESKEHYNEIYVSGVIGQGLIKQDHHSKSLDGVGGEIPPSPLGFSPMKLEPAEKQELNYMPLRDDFEKEYDNDCEKIISGLDISYDEEDVEKELKLSLIDVYYRRLMERDKRKSIAKQHSLIGGKQRLNTIKRKQGRDERELRNKYRSLARLIDNDHYEKLINSLRREKHLRQRISELLKYRRNGITKLEESAEFDVLAQEHEKLQENKDTQVETLGDSVKKKALTPGLLLLTNNERKMCSSLSLKPQEYLTVKSEVIKTSALRQVGVSSKPNVTNDLSIDSKCRLFKYFTKSGWIN